MTIFPSISSRHLLYTCLQIRLFPVDDEGLVFSQEQQKLFALNTTVCFIRACLEIGLDKERITEQYSDSFSVGMSDPAIQQDFAFH